MIESNNEEMYFSQLLKLVREYSHYFWKVKYYLIIFIVVSLFCGAYSWKTSEDLYVGELTYVVNETTGTSIGGAGVLLSQFGLGGSSGSSPNPDRIIYLSRTQRLISLVVMDTAVVGGNADVIGNHLIRIFDLNSRWIASKDSSLHNFLFSEHDNSSNEEVHSKAKKELHALIIGQHGNPILRSNYDNDSGVLYLSGSSPNEDLTLSIVSGVYKYLSDFYVLQSTSKQASSYRLLSAKADSVENVLAKAEYRLAQLQDRSSSILLRTNGTEFNKVSRDIQILSLMYGEVVKNRETAAYLLDSKTPFFQVLEHVVKPLDVESKSLLRTILYSVAIAIFLFIFFFGLLYFMSKLK
jgi:hypothetical protein